jgi:hypothetical protein
MELPHAELLAPLPVLETISGVSRTANVLAVSGKAKDLGELRQMLHQLGELSHVFIAKAFTDTEFRHLAAALPNARGQFVDSFRDAR